MAVSDLLIPIFVLPKRIHDIYVPSGMTSVNGMFGSVICKLFPFVYQTSITVSIFALEILAIEKFFSVFYPMKKQSIHNKRRYFITICCTWLFGAIFWSHTLYTHKIIHRSETSCCIFTWKPAFDDFLLLFTVLPFILLTSLYSTIIISLHRQKSNLHLASKETQRRAKKYRQIAYMLVTIVPVFFATWIPFSLYGFLFMFGVFLCPFSFFL